VNGLLNQNDHHQYAGNTVNSEIVNSRLGSGCAVKGLTLSPSIVRYLKKNYYLKQKNGFFVGRGDTPKKILAVKGLRNTAAVYFPCLFCSWAWNTFFAGSVQCSPQPFANGRMCLF
jgi:hypothetical protein